MGITAIYPVEWKSRIHLLRWQSTSIKLSNSRGFFLDKKIQQSVWAFMHVIIGLAQLRCDQHSASQVWMIRITDIPNILDVLPILKITQEMSENPSAYQNNYWKFLKNNKKFFFRRWIHGELRTTIRGRNHLGLQHIALPETAVPVVTGRRNNLFVYWQKKRQTEK